MIKFKLFIFALLMVAWLCPMTYANDIEGTNTYKDYLFVLVHGINESSSIFSGGRGFGNLKAYLENDLGLKDRVYCYSISNNRGDNYLLGRELSDRSYHNPSPEMGEE